jgi:GNAT superfamily N-acetyltransferase
MPIKKIRGDKLPLAEAKNIAKIWSNEFGESRVSKNIYKEFDANVLFFEVVEAGKIVSVGCLNSVTVEFMAKKYDIQGIGGIVSVIKGKGYGKKLITAIRQYLKKKKLVGIGFCLKKNIPFYEKGGFFTDTKIVKQFVRRDEQGKLHSGENSDDAVIYFNIRSGLVGKIIANRRMKVIIPFWW